MDIMLASAAFAVAVLCAATMGFAIQRGATCTVAAVDELLTKRSARRLLAFGEAALWVAGGLLAARAAGLLPQLPPGYALSLWTLLGGALLGLGAWLNRACVFGAIARLGSGEWAYALTPLGFFIGCASLPWVFGVQAHPRLPEASPVLQLPAWAGGVFLLFVLWRVRPALRGGAWRAWAAGQWSPHGATAVIGVTFLATLLLVGHWAYTDALAELARGMAHSLPARIGLLAALLGGAVLGGWTAGRLQSRRVDAATAARCLAGGALMGWGSLLIPGSNDGLILIGMPLLWPYAWLAFASMCVAIGAAQGLQRMRAPGAAGRGALHG
jgi:Sulphur transport